MGTWGPLAKATREDLKLPARRDLGKDQAQCAHTQLLSQETRKSTETWATLTLPVCQNPA